MIRCKSSSPLLARFLAGGSAFSVLFLWIAAGSSWISPIHCKWLGVLGLFYPLALLGVLFLFVIALLFAPRTVWIALLGLISTWSFTMDYAPLRLLPPISPSADTTTLRVVSYNTQVFGGWHEGRRNGILDYLKAQQADIICFQEGFPDETSTRPLLRKMKNSSTPHFAAYYGAGTSIGILSRYPIIKDERIAYIEGNGIAAFWLQPQENDSLLVVVCHLRSNRLTSDERAEYRELLRQNDHHAATSSSSPSWRLLSKVANASVQRAQMTDTLVSYLEHHKQVPTIVCGDMNETPISYSHHRLTATLHLTDVYRAAGSGIGRSFNKDGIYVRIDQGFCSSHFQPLRATIDPSIRHSDHYPLLFQLRRKK